MLLSFSITNFRSFREEQTISMLASKRLRAAAEPLRCREIPGTDEHALRVASLYGANGAGKSNLVQAISILRQLVLDGTPVGKRILRKPFLLDDESQDEPTVIELQFISRGEVFRYGVSYDENRIHEEWLSVYEGGKEHNLFDRANTKDGAVSVSLGPLSKCSASHPGKVESLAEVGARPNQLFLTQVVNLGDPVAQGPRFESVVRWFSTTLKIIEADAPFVSLAGKIATDHEFAEFAASFLREANTGISSLDVRTTEVSSSGLPTDLTEVLEKALDDMPQDHSFSVGDAGEELFRESENKGSLKFRKIVALHDRETDEKTALPLDEESDGSKRLLNLLPALHRLVGEGGVFVVDELERSMHPMLARKFVEFFIKAGGNGNSQLIFTTHESNLLDLNLVRRDGIWFAEKDREGATHLHSLADFKVRNDLRIEKGYLEGRFGAIPFLGGIDHLIEEQGTAETSK